MPFVHLHNRSQYSLLDGAWSPSDVAKAAAEAQMPAVGLTDTCNLYGAYEFYKATKGAGVKGVFGSVLWMWPPGLDVLQHNDADTGWNIVLLIKGGADSGLADPMTGYRNLCALITTAIFDGMHYRPRIDWDLLRKHRDGLVALTGGLNGALGGAVGARTGGLDGARENLTRMAELFGEDDLFVELQDYGVPRQPELCTAARALARELGLKTVVTNDCRYPTAQDAVTLDVLNCIARGECIDARDRHWLPTDQQFFKTEAQMRELFPDDGEALDRTVEIAGRCRFGFKLGTYYFPATTPPDMPAGGEAPPDTDANWRYFYEAFPPPRDYGMPDPAVEIPPRPEGAGHIDGYFEWYSKKGLELRLQHVPEERHPEYQERLDFEMKIVEGMGFPAYLLIVAEFINWAKDNKIPVGPGRGSGAGSLVNYAMRITDIDPLRFGLLFERFLNPERVSMPDIDVDFCQDRREEVIAHTRDKYGSELVSQIITYGKLQAKAALKDVARICGLEFTAADRIAKLVPAKLGIKLDEALADERFALLATNDPRVARVTKLACAIEGMTRQTGVHAAGVIIADRPLVEHAPLYRDGPDGGPVVQFEMKAAEGVGLIKFDFLGLKTLDQLRDAVAMIARNTGEHIELEHVPLDDTPTFELLQRGDGLGVFQVESSGMRRLLAKLGPTCIDDLIALLALYRPGPLSSGMVDNFIECKHGRKAIEYPHPELEPILESTYGSIVYQEQVMQVAQVLAGYSLGGADVLRRAMGKKKVEEMDKQKIIFVEGATKMGRDPEQAADIFDLLAYFAGYGFNKSHSAAYGVVSYHTAYLKAHHRAEYMAALMTIEANNTDKVLAYIGDCRRAGLDVLPPDVNHSQRSFDVAADARKQIRFGLGAIKGLGDGAIAAIIAARQASDGAFESYLQCLESLDYRKVNKKVLENLIKCGAFDWTGNNRHQMFAALDHCISDAQRAQARKRSGQVSMFTMMGSAPKQRLVLPDVAEWPTARRLGFERDALGFFITGHPIEAYRDVVDRITTCRISQLENLRHDSPVRIAGMVTAKRKLRTKRGNLMGFATVEDDQGSVECTFFSDPWVASEAALLSEQPVVVSGTVERTEDGGAKIMGESAQLLSEVRERTTRVVHLCLESTDLGEGRIEGLVRLLQESRGPRPVHVHVRRPGHSWTSLRLPAELKITPDDAFFEGMETLFRRVGVVRLR